MNILAHVLIALDECHARGEIVKNLMTDHVYLVDSKDASSCRVKIGSFSNYKYKEEEEKITKEHGSMANYWYKPKENKEGPWQDIWSIGVILWEMCKKDRVWGYETAPEYTRVTWEQVLETMSPDAEFRDLVEMCL